MQSERDGGKRGSEAGVHMGDDVGDDAPACDAGDDVRCGMPFGRGGGEHREGHVSRNT